MELIHFDLVSEQLQQFDSGAIPWPDLGDLSGLSDQEVLLLALRFPGSTCPLVRAITKEQRRNLFNAMSQLSQGLYG